MTVSHFPLQKFNPVFKNHPLCEVYHFLASCSLLIFQILSTLFDGYLKFDKKKAFGLSQTNIFRDKQQLPYPKTPTPPAVPYDPKSKQSVLNTISK